MTLAPFTSRRLRGAQLAGIPAYRWDPRRELDDITSRFGQLMQTVLGDPTTLAPAAWSQLTPPIDVEEVEDAYVIDVDLPNVDPSDVDLEMRGEELRISGSFQERERGGQVRRQNRPTGEFEYIVDLPSDIDASRVEATYNNGVLTVRVGKRRDAQPRRIEIQGQQQGQLGQQQQGQRQGQQGQQQGQQGQQGQQQGQQGQQQGQQGRTGQGGQSRQGDRR
ncbi:Hsp20/alpha crystallin family protein [Dactylosporangium sp. CA-139114]|uniref:Hsp20/alpha crystallin family protein n=1 Tax=Dactylosporangium sp. CA-139114 TaxID=3239931 RepID=UPI003D95391E